MTEFKLDELRKIQAEACKTFGNPKRLLIVETLWDKELSYSTLMQKTGLDKVTLTQQTTYMRRKGILVSRRVGGTLMLAVANTKILTAFGLMREVVIDKIKKDHELLSVVSR
ncbi:MAG: hypothetical protein P1S46_12075 [bacterium]|nr:hypothetical protein [bacterium]MDT8396873.1 hypothetical protein [bacterium]